MVSDSAEFDEFFLAIAQRQGKIEHFLDSVFSFLQRKTDFFHVMLSPTDKLGFPKGKAQDMLYAIFAKHQATYLNRAQPELLKEIGIANTVGRREMNRPKKSVQVSKEHKKTENKSEMISDTSDCSTTQHNADVLQLKNNCLAKQPDVCKKVMVNAAEGLTENKTNSSKLLKVENNGPQCRISTWNGGQTERYFWNQTLKEVTIEVSFPPPFPVAKSQVLVNLKSKHMNVILDRTNILLDGILFESICVDGSTWCIEDGKRLLLVLEKSGENWWGSVFQGEKQIDLTKVESVKTINDFDDETQASLRRVLWDREQEIQGLKTSEQLKTEEALRKAWNSESSPFKGQPFDPSVLNFSAGASNANSSFYK